MAKTKEKCTCQETAKKIFKRMNQCSSMTEMIKTLEKIEEEYGKK